MNTRMKWCLALALSLAPAAAHAQDRPMPMPAPVPAAADSAAAAPEPPLIGPPIQQIATASFLSQEPLGSIMSVYELPGGRLLVNDGMRRRLLLMDTALTTVGVVLDSLSAVANTYGTRPGALLPYRGDTTLFVDPASYAMVVIDPDGQVVRVRSVWRVQDVGMLGSSFFGVPGVDARGRIVYRIRAMPAPPKVAPPSGIPYIPPEPDSAFVIAVDIETRRIDTLASIRVPKQDLRVRRDVEGRFMIESVVNPLPLTDDWAVLPDGRVAIARGLDYRIEYLSPDGSITSSPKLPYEWQRMAEDDKDRMVDSVRTVLQNNMASQYVTSLIRWVNQYNRNYPPDLAVPENYRLPPGLPRDWILPQGVQFPESYMYACPPGVEPSPMAMGGGGAPVPVANTTGGAAPGAAPCAPAPITFSSGQTPPMPRMRTVHVLPAGDLPDYRPPFPASTMRADMEGNLWIRTNPTRPTRGGPVYDIISPEGELVTRYQLPPGYTIVGFGRDRVVYLSMRDPTGLKLARVHLK